MISHQHQHLSRLSLIILFDSIMASSAPQQSEPKSVYNDKALESRIKLKRYALTLAEGIKHPKNSQFGKTILPMGNMTPVELSMETELLPHTQLKIQNFLSINPSETKPQQPPKVAMVAYTPRKITVPVLRVNSLDTENVITMLAAFSCPFFYEKFTPYECTNIDIIRAWCSLYGAIDRDFGTAVANTGLDMANCRVVIEDYNDAASFLDAYTAEVPMFGTHLAKLEEHDIAGDTSLMVIMCVLCQTAGKFVYADNYTKWYTNRAKVASGLIGGCNLDSVIAAIPTMNGLQTGYNALGSVFEFRRMIVDRMFVYSEGRSVISRLFGLTLQMLASTELTHVYNIDLYIMKMAPNVNNCLADNHLDEVFPISSHSLILRWTLSIHANGR